MYNPADKNTLLSEKPAAVEFNGEDRGCSIKEVLGSENVDESGFIKSLTKMAAGGHRFNDYDMSNTRWAV